MKISLEIPVELEPSFTSFIQKYYSTQSFDSVTGELLKTPMYTTEEFVLFQINTLSLTVAKEFPPLSTKTERDQIAVLEQAIMDKTKATWKIPVEPK